MPVNGFLVEGSVQKYNYESLVNYNTPDFSTSSTYQVGDYVMYQGKLYKCITAITTSGAWDSTKWSLAILSDDVADLKSAADNIKTAFPYYPMFIRGSGNTTTGVFVPSETVLNRLIEMEFISTSDFDEFYAKAGISFIVFYYDSNEAFVSADGGWKTGSIVLDKTKAYCRFLLKNTDESSFDSVPVDAAYVINTEKVYGTEEQLREVQAKAESIDNAIYGLAYSENGSVDAGAASTVRWFIRQEFRSGWLHAIKLYGSSQGALTVELWERVGENYTRYASKDAYVYVGENSIEIDTQTRDNTWISFAPSVTGPVRVHSTGISGSCYIVRDKSSTSFTQSSFESQPFRIIADVILYALPDVSNYVTQHTYSIGENDNVAAVLTEAMRYPNSIVYIEPYEHDCIMEWEAFYGSNYFTNMSSGRGLELGNGIHIIGRSGHKLKCWYTGNNDYVMENFSLFNNSLRGIGYTLENVCIDTKKIRYCIHDERSGDLYPYKVCYSRCIMSQDMTDSTWDHSRACIGGGLGSYGDVIVEDCIFSTVTSAQNMDSLAYHNGNAEECENSIVIKNCYCTGDSTLQLASYGPSTKKTKVIVANCSFGSPIEILDWTSGTPNFEIYQINNEIRNN